jgi:2-dehydro-3-deoxygluconokinase
MLELSRRGADWRLGYAGDSFNTALYLQRLGVSTAYLTALGDDPFSTEMRAAWQSEGLDLSLVLTDTQRLPGLYAIRTSSSGERSFSYWRQQAAVRELFRLPGIQAALERARCARLLYMSGITLSLFEPADQEQLVDVARSVRQGGGVVAFDLNYRPAGWAGASAAQEAVARLAGVVSWALPTFEDAAQLYGNVSPEQTVTAWQERGATEVVVKLGAQGCLVAAAGRRDLLPAVPVGRVVDTTGAGDAFNAGYLAGRLRGLPPLQAARAAQILAAEVIQHPGAVVPTDAMPRILQRLGDSWK